MDTENKKRPLPRPVSSAGLPPPRGSRALPPMPSEDTGDEMPLTKTRKKKPKKEANGFEGSEGMEMDETANRRRSESREELSPEPQDIPPQKKKKKRKTQTSDQEGDVMNDDGTEQNTDREEVTRKSKKKRKPKMTETHYGNDLDVEDDDIITDLQTPVPRLSLFSAPVGRSQPVSKVFVERTRRFQAADRFDLGRSGGQLESYMEVRPLWTTRDVALRVHNAFRMIGLFSHGFLAGYAVWNIVVVYVLAGKQLSTLPNLLQQYHTLAYPSQSLLYLLLSISIVSSFDRVNLAKASVALRGFLTLDPAALASFLYFAALILSLSQQMASDRINLYPTANETLWPPGSEHRILQPWIAVNLVVALMVGLAWIFVSTRHEVDFTEEFLMAMEVDEYPRHVERPEVPP